MTNGAKRRIVAAIDDIFFAAKVRAAAESAGVTLELVKSREAALAALAVAPTADLLIADLHSTRGEPLALARDLKMAEATRHIPLLGFYSHVQTELKEQALEAGFDRVMPRSAFAAHLGSILGGTDDI